MTQSRVHVHRKTSLQRKEEEEELEVIHRDHHHLTTPDRTTKRTSLQSKSSCCSIIIKSLQSVLVIMMMMSKVASTTVAASSMHSSKSVFRRTTKSIIGYHHHHHRNNCHHGAFQSCHSHWKQRFSPFRSSPNSRTAIGRYPSFLLSNNKNTQQYDDPILMASSTRLLSSINNNDENNHQYDQHDYNNDNDNDNVNNKLEIILNGLNPSQIQAVTQPLQSITRVVAGPGAGKTRVLTCRIAYLLKQDNDTTYSGNNRSSSSRVLAVTFTKKAAMEMQHRLEQLLLEDEEAYNNHNNEQNHHQEDNNNNDDNDETIYQEEANPNSFNNAASHKDTVAKLLKQRVTLGTFHSVCSKILRWHGSELSSLPSISQYTRSSSSNNSNNNNNKNTTSLTLDGSFAIVDQTEQLRIIKQCITECGIDLKKNGRSPNPIRPITILNAVGQLKLDDAIRTTGGGGGGGSHSGSSSKNEAVGIKMTDRVREIALEIQPLYQKNLLTQNSLDFDDLILLTRELLKVNPSSVREKMRRRWNHILVDEYQDTSEVQMDLVKLLTSNSLLVVGDGDQSIYSWRGAYAESMTDFANEFSKSMSDDSDNDDDNTKKKVDTVYLMENYRSTTNIVKAAQKVISDKSSSTASPQAFIRQDMKPIRGKGPSPRVLACANAKAEASFVIKEIQKMEENETLLPSSTVALIYRTNAQSRALEEACVAANMRYLVRGSAGTFYSRAEIKDCLCFLKWLHNGRERTSIMRCFKTPARGIGEVSMKEFFDYCEENEKFVMEQDSNNSVVPSPLDTLIGLTDFERGENFSYLPPDGIMSKRTLNRILPFASQMKNLRRRAELEDVSTFISTLIDTLQLRAHFDSISKTSDEFADRWNNVMELRNAAERYVGPCMVKTDATNNSDDNDDEFPDDSETPLGQFLDDVSLLTEVASEDDSESDQERLQVNLMTIHASKGMEFDSVFLVGNEEGTFPTQRSIAEGEGSIELDEERRLCYVAMTRAKTHLVMTWRREVVTFFGQGMRVDQGERSRFLDILVTKKKKPSPSSASSSVRPVRRDTIRAANPRSRERNFSSSARSPPRLDNSDSWQDWKPASERADNFRKRAPSKTQSAEDWQNWKPASERRNSPRRNTTTVSPRKTASGGQMRQRRAPDSVARRQERFDFSKPAASPPDLDSTVFYPIGSRVAHSVHGDGMVLPPTSSSNGSKEPSGDDSLLVKVKFSSGMEMDFPVGDSGLRIQF